METQRQQILTDIIAWANRLKRACSHEEAQRFGDNLMQKAMQWEDPQSCTTAQRFCSEAKSWLRRLEELLPQVPDTAWASREIRNRRGELVETRRYPIRVAAVQASMSQIGC
jgi:hypothetical protein